MKLSAIVTTIAFAAALPAATSRLSSDVATSVASDQVDLENAVSWRKKHHDNGTPFPGWHTLFGLELEMHHLDYEDSAQIHKDGAYIDAYKEAFEEIFGGMKISWAVGDNEGVTPESDGDSEMLGRSYYYGGWWHLLGGGYCRLCAYNALGTEGDTALTETDDAFLHDPRWEQVGPAICDKLKATGYERFAHIERCTTRPNSIAARDAALMIRAKKQQLSSLEKKKTTPTPQPMEGSIKASITVHKVRSSPNINVEFLDEAFAGAYNLVHEGSKFSVTNMELEHEITVPEDDSSVTAFHHMKNNKLALVGDEPDGGDGDDGGNGDDGGDDDDQYLMAKYWVKVDWFCTDCTNQEMILPGALQGLDLHDYYSPEYHQTFETVFCILLRSSPGGDFEDAMNCQINFEVV